MRTLITVILFSIATLASAETVYVYDAGGATMNNPDQNIQFHAYPNSECHDQAMTAMGFNGGEIVVHRDGELYTTIDFCWIQSGNTVNIVDERLREYTFRSSQFQRTEQ